MQRDMKWDVTCCTVTSASLLGILCLAYSIAMRSLQGRNTMTSQPIRDQVEDHLITPKNAALIIIDYQPPQVSSIVSMDHRTLVANIVATARLAKVFALPIVLSTVNVKTGGSAPTVHQLAEVLAGIEELDRATIHAWEDEEFVTAVKATGRKKLIMTALWTEACLTFPALDALREGYEVYPVVDAVGGTSVEAHRAGLERIVQAGAQPTSVVQLMCELQRDWARTETVQPLQQSFIDHDAFQCGYCTPGQLCSAVGMLREAEAGWPSAVSDDLTASHITLDDDEIRERMSGNLCRCAAYANIVPAIREAVQQPEQEAQP